VVALLLPQLTPNLETSNRLQQFEDVMADVKQMQFMQRLRRIDRYHRTLANGYVATVKADGLIVAAPYRKSSHRTVRSLFLLLAIMLAFKVFLYAQIGGAAYERRVASLQGGSVAQQVGAYVMDAGTVTVWSAGIVNKVIR
jgi:hypothetical protein